MKNIPNILYSVPRFFCEEASAWAENNLHLISEARQLCEKPESNIRHEISLLDDIHALKLIIACLGYTKIEPSELGLPSAREKLKLNIKECGDLLNIPSSAIRPIATIEQDLLTLISQK